MQGTNNLENQEDDEQSIARRRDEAIRRALNTPPKPLKEYVGKSKRAIAQRVSTPEEKCIDFPEQKYISEAGKKGR